jgi:hypothetical protein
MDARRQRLQRIRLCYDPGPPYRRTACPPTSRPLLTTWRLTVVPVARPKCRSLETKAIRRTDVWRDVTARRCSVRARERSRVLTALGLLAASFLASGGCSGHAPYPKTWPPLPPASGQSCERVAGNYWNRGERGQMEQYGPVYLTEMLLNVPARTETEMATLAFLRPDQFDVVIAGAEPAPRRLSLSRKAGQYRCDGSTLVINTSPAKWEGGVAPQGVPGVGGASVMMKVDLVGGCLIVTRRDKQFLLLPFPGWSTWSSWYRFCAVPPAAALPSGRGTFVAALLAIARDPKCAVMSSCGNL